MKAIVGILLAAGSSKRFGADKRLHLLPDGTPLALAAARRLAEACDRTIVVIRPGDAALAQRFAAERIGTTVCNNAELGMGESLSAGVAASADASAWLVALADMPYIEPASYRVVLQALQQGALLARPTYHGKMGHPVGFDARYRPELLALTGDQGGRLILEAHADGLHCCPVDDPGVIQDIDQVSQVRTT